jgi:hypothetical protein
LPSYPQPTDQWFANLLSQLRQGVAALSAGGTFYVVDPTILNPSAGSPNCKAIIGDISHDNFGNSTGLSGWGFASHKTGSWVQL